MIINNNAKRVWFITDTHLGVRNNSNEWIASIREYFFDWFFPLVRENYKEGDVLMHLGDFFDSRQSINLKVLNLGIEIAEEISNIFGEGIYFIVGNHDIFGRYTNETNSLKSLKWIPGITILEEPETLIFNDKTFLMMPWRKDHEEEEKTLEEAKPHDYLCCHADIRGLKFNKFVKVESGASTEKFKKFKRVYSGHIHYSQRVGNINMLGSPYEITRSDMGNPKGITLLNIETFEETYFPNDFSPKFKKYFFKDMLEMTISELEPDFKNNFVDVMIDPGMSIRAPLNILTDLLQSQRNLSFHPYDPDQANNLTKQIMDTEGKHFNVIDFVSEYVNNTEYDDATKTRMIKSLLKLHDIVKQTEI